MTVAALGTLVWRHPLADVAAKAAAPIGAAFTLMCLITGSLWGRPMWGTYWVWDARLTSVLVLLLMYLGVMALWRTIDEPTRAAKAVAVLTLVGAINIPIIKFSVDWWNTLHQPASLIRLGGPAIHRFHSVAPAGDADCVHASFPDAAFRRHAQRDRAAQAANHADDAGRKRRGERAMNLGPHAAFIVAAYAAAGTIVVSLILWIVLERRQLSRALGELEAQGLTRRSQPQERP